MAVAAISRTSFTRSCLLLGLLAAGSVSADETLEGYFIYDYFVVLCPISEASLPNVRDIDPNSLDSQTAAVVSFYQFVISNFSGYCLVELRLQNDTRQEVFIPHRDYNAMWDIKNSSELQKRNQSYLVRMKTQVVADQNNTALRGYELSYELVDRRPEIIN